MNVGQKIRILREKHGLKQINLANALQVSPQAVSKWEKDANYPDLFVLMKIARFFDVSTDYLLGLTERENGTFDATVFCSSINSFERFSMFVNSKEIADHANVVFYHLTESVLKYDGIPVKYVGDGFLCFFSGAEHADRALEAAIHAKRVISRNDLVISLNSGDIYLGLIGHPRYAMRDIVGETVNRAFIIMEWISKNCDSCVGATSTVLERTKKAYQTAHHHDVVIDLLEKKVDIYEIISKKKGF